ncbi:FecR family protein [Butyricimonas faecihominis]|jgi:transmembrane sensor
MDDKKINIEELLVRILENRAGSEEIRYFSKWMEGQENRVYFEKFKKIWNFSAGSHASPEMLEAGVRDYRLFMEKSLKSKMRVTLMWRIGSVAAVLLMILYSVFWLRKDVSEVSSGEKYVVSSGREVILKLADNKEIILGDSLNLSGVAGEWVSINKVDHRGIVYRLKDSMGIKEEELSYNQIIVPAGERFLVQLSDGTKVWINSESALRYPAYFGKNIREVEARGNVYFEVVKDSTRPFVVASRELTTEVLGTRFEVNTYGDRDEVSATLVEGSVRVGVGSRFVVIKPNQQFTFNTKSGTIEVNEVDAAREVMWKDGILVIDNEAFRDVVWKLERWYGVSIVNETGLVFTQSFSGEFDREDIHMAIESLCTNLNITYTMDKDRIILKR